MKLSSKKIIREVITSPVHDQTMAQDTPRSKETQRAGKTGQQRQPLTVLYEQLLHTLQQLVAVAICVDPDGLEFLVSHLSEDVQRDVLTLKDVPEVVQAQAEGGGSCRIGSA